MSSRPAPASKTSVSATSATTSADLPKACPLVTAAVATALQRQVRFCLRRLERWHHTKENAGDDCRGNGCEGNDPIERDRIGARHIAGKDTRQQSKHPGAEHQARGAAHDPKQCAFGEQLSDEPPAPGAKRSADGHLPAAAGRTRNQQARHVGARDDQHETDRGLEHEEPEADVSDDVFTQIVGADVAIRRGRWVTLRDQ